MKFRDTTVQKYKALLRELAQVTSFNLDELVKQHKISVVIRTFLTRYYIEPIGGTKGNYKRTALFNKKLFEGGRSSDLVFDEIIQELDLWMSTYRANEANRGKEEQRLLDIIARHEEREKYMVDSRTVVTADTLTLKTLPPGIFKELTALYTKAVTMASLTDLPVEKCIETLITVL